MPMGRAVADAKAGIGASLSFYNDERQSVGYRTSRQIYQEGLWICGRSALPTAPLPPLPEQARKAGKCSPSPPIPTGTATNKAFDIDEMNSTRVEPAVAPTAIGADVETGRATP
jgi:hypothetical protein